MSKALYEASPEDAARVIARQRGHSGGLGGWIYNEVGRVICRGWTTYAGRLQLRGAIVPKKVTDPRSGKKVVRWAINWRALA